jgi:hypothetical protein
MLIMVMGNFIVDERCAYLGKWNLGLDIRLCCYKKDRPSWIYLEWMGIVLPFIPLLVKKGASTSERRYCHPHHMASRLP